MQDSRRTFASTCCVRFFQQHCGAIALQLGRRCGDFEVRINQRIAAMEEGLQDSRRAPPPDPPAEPAPPAFHEEPVPPPTRDPTMAPNAGPEEAIRGALVLIGHHWPNLVLEVASQLRDRPQSGEDTSQFPSPRLSESSEPPQTPPCVYRI